MKTSEHHLVPQHSKLTKERKKELLEKYGINTLELPKIFRNDPAIKHLNVESGDVIKVIRASGTSGKAVYYRAVIGG